MSDNSIKKSLLEHLRISKEQKEPLLAGSEYVLTKQVIQAYEESIRYCQEQVARFEADLRSMAALPRNAQLVTAGFRIKGYALAIPVHDDYDMGLELESIIDCLKETHSLQGYLDFPDSRGRMRLYPYQVEELSIIFPEFFGYSLIDELERMKKSFEASYGRQVYEGTMDKLKLAISWESNHAMTKGNEELALRMKESDTTLMLGIAANPEAETKKAIKPRSEPSREEIEAALQEMALKDLEIRTPSQIASLPPVEDRSVAIDTVNVPKRQTKRKIVKKTAPKPAREKAPA